MNTTEFKKSEDGKYRWQYDMDMMRNKSIVWIVFKILGVVLLYASLIMSVWSGWDYVYKNRALIAQE